MVEEFISNRIDRIVRDMKIIRQPTTVGYIVVKVSVLIKNEKEFFFFFFYVDRFDSFPYLISGNELNHVELYEILFVIRFENDVN